jgi:hypothetical protein
MNHLVDFYAWTREQAARLRDAAAAGTNLPIDWLAVAEEIEDLGKSEQRELGSRIATIIEHLLKLQFSPAQEPRLGWIETIVRSRKEIAKLLRRNPSLKPEIVAEVADEMADTAELVVAVLGLHGEVDQELAVRIRGTAYTPDQVVGDWLPGGQ